MKIQTCREKIKTAGDTVFRNWTALFSFEILYQMLFFYILLPLAKALLGLLPALMGQPYISPGNFHLIFRHPLAILLLLVIVLIFSIFVYFEMVTLFLYCEKGWKREDLSLWRLCKNAVLLMGRLFRPKSLPVFVLCPVMLFSFFSFSGGYLHNIRFFEILMRYIKEKPYLFVLFAGLILLCYLISFFYLFGIPALLFERKSFPASWKESQTLLKRNKLRIAGKLLFYSLIFYIAFLLLSCIGIFFLAGGIRLFCDPVSRRAQFQLYFLSLQTIWMAVFRVIASVFFCALVVILYHERRKDLRPQAFRTQSLVKQLAFCAAVLLIAAGILFCPGVSELGGNIWRQKDLRTKVVAHRAGAAFAPENTAEALRQAIQMGVHMAEIDVQQLKDGTLIVIHDTNFKRTTGIDLGLRDADYETVRKMDAGSFFSSEFAGEPIPTLEEMLSAAKGRIRLMIELKAGGYHDGLEQSTLALLEKYGMRDQCVIASMDLDILERVKALDAQMPTVYISARPLPEEYHDKNIDAYSVKMNLLSMEMVTEMHKAGKQIYAWTANSEETMRRILYYGADGIITDNPVLAKICVRSGSQKRFVNKLTAFFYPRSPG